MEQTDRQRTLRENLKDAGCGEPLIQRLLYLEQTGCPKEQLLLLTRYRGELLDRLHLVQKRIDCLDYLIYRIQQKP